MPRAPDLLTQALPYLKALNERALTIRNLAQTLECDESYLSRLLKPHLKRVESTTKTREKLSVLRRYREKLREKHAFLYKNGEKSLKKAAADARCSERTIRRYAAQL